MYTSLRGSTRHSTSLLAVAGALAFGEVAVAAGAACGGGASATAPDSGSGLDGSAGGFERRRQLGQLGHGLVERERRRGSEQRQRVGSGRWLRDGGRWRFGRRHGAGQPRAGQQILHRRELLEHRLGRAGGLLLERRRFRDDDQPVAARAHRPISRRTHVLRFMDWNQTNDSNNAQAVWSTRKQKTAAAERAGGVRVADRSLQPHQEGLLAQRPARGPADYWTELAQLVSTPSSIRALRVYVEWSNEVWNTGFPQHAYAASHATSLGLPGNDARDCLPGLRVGAHVRGVRGRVRQGQPAAGEGARRAGRVDGPLQRRR